MDKVKKIIKEKKNRTFSKTKQNKKQKNKQTNKNKKQKQKLKAGLVAHSFNSSAWEDRSRPSLQSKFQDSQGYTEKACF